MQVDDDNEDDVSDRGPGVAPSRVSADSQTCGISSLSMVALCGLTRRHNVRLLPRIILHDLQAIEEVGDRVAHPRDYLNFFMLAKCEKRLPDEPEPKKQPKKRSPAGRAQQHRRSPVYVHSKTLVIDDEVRSVAIDGPPVLRCRLAANRACCRGHAVCALRQQLGHASLVMTLSLCTDAASDDAAPCDSSSSLAARTSTSEAWRAHATAKSASARISRSWRPEPVAR